MSGADRAPERAPLVEITRTEALLWLNDRVGGIVSVTVQVDHGESNSRVLLIGDAGATALEQQRNRGIPGE
jgi:hypothetical protein